MHGNHEVRNIELQGYGTHDRLQAQIDFSITEILRSEGRELRRIKSLNVGPLQGGNVGQELQWMRQAGTPIVILLWSLACFAFKPRCKPIAEVAQGEAARWMLLKVALGETAKDAVSYQSCQRRKVLSQRIQQAEPVLPVIDFQPFQAAELVARRDNALDLFTEPVITDVAHHAEIPRQRTHNCRCHPMLQLLQLHAATSHACLRKCVAFRASACTSSNGGMLSSHSSSVGVGPTRRMAWAYRSHTGSHIG